MTNDQINKAIAQVCGWRQSERNISHWHHVSAPHSHILVGDLPNYCGCLNAMHEAEKVLGSRLREYGEHLCEMTVVSEHDFPACYIWHATAHQRAEAFLRVLGKWATAEECSAVREEVQP